MDSFELRERDVPEPRHGELLVRVRYLSVDPYMRGRMRDSDSYADPWTVGEPLSGGVVGEVVESESDAYEAGDLVSGNGTWADYSLLDAANVAPVDPSVADLPAYLGVLGMPGRTAYFGLLEVGAPKPGDTVVVSGAAGAVGSVVGQIAKHNGCRVVGFAGSEEKVDWLTEDLGFDAGINYKQVDDYSAALDDAAPDGVGVYFDNVGGPISDAVFTKLNVDARVAVCGQIAHYNNEDVPTGPRKLPSSSRPARKSRGCSLGTSPPGSAKPANSSGSGSRPATSSTARRSSPGSKTRRTRSSGCSPGTTSASRSSASRSNTSRPPVGIDGPRWVKPVVIPNVRTYYLL